MIFGSLSFRGCGGQPLALLWNIRVKSQMPIPPEHAFIEKLPKFWSFYPSKRPTIAHFNVRHPVETDDIRNLPKISKVGSTLLSLLNLLSAGGLIAFVFRLRPLIWEVPFSERFKILIIYHWSFKHFYLEFGRMFFTQEVQSHWLIWV